MPEFILPAHSLGLSDAFTNGFIEAMFFTNQGEGIDDAASNGFTLVRTDFGPDDLAPQTLAVILAQCAAFKACAGDLIDGREEEAGRDFWYTREGHGVGFWDGDWNGEELEPYVPGDENGVGCKPAVVDKSTADALTALAKLFEETYAYVGDDGLIYFMSVEGWEQVAEKIEEAVGFVKG